MNDFDDMSIEELREEIKRLKNIIESRKKEDVISPFGRNMRYLRMRYNITQKEFYDLLRNTWNKMDNHKSTLLKDELYFGSLQMYENASGLNVPRKYKAVVCEALNVDPELMEKDWFEIAKGENE